MADMGVYRHSLARVAWVVGLTVLLWTGAIILYARIIRFDGIVPVQVGDREHLVLAPAGSGGRFAAYRNMPLEVLPLRQPRAAISALDADRLWDARDLGFPLRIRAAEVIRRFPDRYLLEIRKERDCARSLIFPGARVLLDDFAVTVQRVGPWAGLIHVPGGQPALAWSVREAPGAPWKQGLFVRPDAPSWAGKSALMFMPAVDETQAQALLPETLDPDTGGRWGARSRNNTQWIEALRPGSGLVLGDGREITLQGKSPGDPPELVFVVDRPPRAGTVSSPDPRKFRVPVNGDPVDIGSETFLVAEAPALAEESVWGVSWQDNEILAAVYGNGRRSAPRHLLPGDTLPLRNGWTLRFDQALRESVQAGTFEEPVLAAVVTLPDGSEAVLREGLPVPAGPYYLRFTRQPVPPEVRYVLADASRDDARPVTLGPGETITLRGWVLSQYPDAPDPERIALIRARATWWSSSMVWGLALILAAAVSRAVLLLLPRRGSGSLPPDPPVTPEHQE